MHGLRDPGSTSRVVLSALILAIGGALPAQAQQYTAEIAVDVEVWPEKIWDYFRFFCSPIVNHNGPSTCTEGGGGVGSIRVLGDGGQELLTALTPLSYTYQAIAGPLAELDFQVTLSVAQREDPLTSTITAILVWDEEPIPADERLAVQYRFTSAMRGDLVYAKTQAEAS